MGVLFIHSLFLLAICLPADLTSQIIPTSFPLQDPAQYTTRYLSQSKSKINSEECLDQPYNLSTPLDGDEKYCSTLRYSLVGNSSSETAYNVSSLILLVSPGTYTFEIIGISLQHSKNLIIAKNPMETGNVTFKCQSYNTTNFNNLYIRYLENVAVLGIQFSNCGPYSPAFVLRNGVNVSIDSCTFENNLNSGLNFNQINNATVTNTIFQNNNASFPYRHNDSLIEYLGFRHSGGFSLSYKNDRSGADYTLIKNCSFNNNYAGVHYSNTMDYLHRPNLYIPRGHGGGLLISFQNTTNYTIVIEDSSFSNNFARFSGGAISILLYRGSIQFDSVMSSSNNNTVLINRVRFVNNKCNGSGGAVGISAYEAANFNKVIVRDSLFENNHAEKVGGAYSLVIEDNVVLEGTKVISNLAILERSHFIRNSVPFHGGGGSSINLESNARVDQATNSAQIYNCTFIGNKANRSAVLSLRYPLSLYGTNIFKENEGGAMTLLQTRLECNDFIWFEANSARNGGAIELLDQSDIYLTSGVNMTFLSNDATNHGGALKVATASIASDVNFQRLYNRCFFQYSDTFANPNNWNARVYFTKNTAKNDGAAIYADDIAMCVYAPGLNGTRTPNISETDYDRSIFRTSSPFVLSDNILTKNVNNNTIVEDIATEPSFLIIEPQILTGAPGQILHLNISIKDQSGNGQPGLYSSNFKEGVFSLNVGLNEAIYQVESPATYEINETHYNVSCKQSDEFQKEVNLTYSLIQTISGEVSDTTIVTLTITCCHPGYVFDTSASTCDHRHSNDRILREDEDNNYVYIQPHIYGNYRNRMNTWASIPAVYQDCQQQGEIEGCLFKYDKPEEQCAHDRTGFLCGECPNGTSVDLTLSTCVQCEPWHAFMISAIILAFILVCALIMIFNIGISNEFRGFLFYIQVVGFVYSVSAGNNVTWDFHLSSFFGFSLYIPLCPFPGYNALYTAALGFIPPLMAIMTIIVYIISAKFIKHLSRRNSFDGIWFLTFIIYKFIADTCFSILRCKKVENGDQVEFVYYYDGSLKCFDSEYGVYLSFSILASILVILIIFFTIFILVISYKRFQWTQNMTDVLNKDLKGSYRWWGSFDLFRRILFSLVVILISSSADTQEFLPLALLYSGLIVFFTFACTQPYTSKRANFIEVMILLDLLLISALSLDTSPLIQKRVRPYTRTLLILPFLSITIYFTVKIAAIIWNKVSPVDFKAFIRSRFCKLMNRFGMKSLFGHNLECSMVKSTTLVHARSVDEDPDEDDEDGHMSEYTVFREELLED